MASQRLLTAIFLISIAVVIQAAHKNDLIVGSRIPCDYLVSNKTVFKAPSVFQIVTLKQTFIGDNYSKFTHIRLLDQNNGGNADMPAIIAGGIGRNFVTVEFKSARSRSIHYIAEIYGKI